MFIVCSNCEFKYLVNSADLKPNGRMVECANCNHQWFQELHDTEITSSVPSTKKEELDKNLKDTKNILKELPEIIEWIKKQVNLIRGTILNTQLINDGYDFLILGTYFERADFTARIINVKYRINN